MSKYKTKLETIQIGNISLEIISLLDKQQFDDPGGEAEKLGISDSMWPISGLIWPSGLVLAKIVNDLDIANISILEVGCGIGLASLVAAHKNADITASDYHPIVQTFLLTNAKSNSLNIKYVHCDWNHPIKNQEKFDLIIGSDLLYERGCHELLSSFINGRLAPKGKVILIDPGRMQARKIIAEMESLGFSHEVIRLDAEGKEKNKGYFAQYTFVRK